MYTGPERGRGDKAHRVSFRLFKGEIPEGKIVLHSCDIRCCVNPAHLRAGTYLENNLDCVNRGRHFVPDNRGEKQGCSKLTESQVADIRRREKFQRDYAAIYGVSRQTISDVQRGKSWAHAR